MARDGSESAESWRQTCRLGHSEDFGFELFSNLTTACLSFSETVSKINTDRSAGSPDM